MNEIVQIPCFLHLPYFLRLKEGSPLDGGFLGLTLLHIFLVAVVGFADNEVILHEEADVFFGGFGGNAQSVSYFHIGFAVELSWQSGKEVLSDAG